MKKLFLSKKLLVVFSVLFGFVSLMASIYSCNAEWFQASGAVITVAGVILAARKLIRFGFEKYLYAEEHHDYGHIVPTPEEKEESIQIKKDLEAYQASIWLLVLGTLIWAYGGLLLKAFGVGYA